MLCLQTICIIKPNLEIVSFTVWTSSSVFRVKYAKIIFRCDNCIQHAHFTNSTTPCPVCRKNASKNEFMGFHQDDDSSSFESEMRIRKRILQMFVVAITDKTTATTNVEKISHRYYNTTTI
jgi:hypothetical protein